ncbi:uncharacterized protein LOC108905573 [Anoplophora glabripennis]|uniref:uncharacterized protein LOC108905573 n=1 Tax=Anoplophora glabripennis TaxID=217634 RepID=UPI000873C341|nr:uncharacterized protein LOC108905573 [Anoplophora glabripennis]
MFPAIVTKLFLLSVFAASIHCDEGEYYWRPWTSGSPPSDAVTARDYRGVSYIVEGYVPNRGLYIGQAFANQHQVNVSVSNSTRSSTFIVADSRSLKVLCAKNLEKLAWYPITYSTLQNELVTAVINPVLGGFNADDQVVYIGRFVDNSRRIVILGSVVQDNYLHYHYGGKAYLQGYYEILVIGSKCISY